MRVGRWLGVGLVVAGMAFAADDISKMAAKDVMKKAAADMDALPGYHVKIDASVQGLPGGVKAEGIYVKPDVYYLKTDAGLEIYMKGKKGFAKDPASGKWQDASTINDPTAKAAIVAAQSINPAAILAIMGKSATAKYRDDEKLGDNDCKVIEVPGSPDDVKGLLDDVAKNMPMLKGANLSSFIDKDKSKSTYVAWVGKADLLVYKAVLDAQVEMKPNPSLPNLPSFKHTTTIEFSKHGKELDLNAPDEVKKGLGLK